MARSLANMVCRNIAAFPAVRSSACGSFYQSRFCFSTTPNDPDTHEDFRPTSKVESSSISLKDIVEQDIKENPVMIYMKDVPLGSRNILEDLELKTAVKSFSHWPTFPQIFINGEFIGGSDIILDMHKSGELKEKLNKNTGKQQ